MDSSDIISERAPPSPGKAAEVPLSTWATSRLELFFWDASFPWMPTELRPWAEELVFRVVPLLRFPLGYLTRVGAGFALVIASLAFLRAHDGLGWLDP